MRYSLETDGQTDSEDSDVGFYPLDTEPQKCKQKNILFLKKFTTSIIRLHPKVHLSTCLNSFQNVPYVKWEGQAQGTSN